MRIFRRISIWGWLAVAGMLAGGCAHETSKLAATEPTGPMDLQQLQAQLDAAQAKVRALEAKAYAAKPELAAAEKKLDELSDQRDDASDLYQDRVDLLLAMKKDANGGDDSLGEQFDLLQTQWQLVRRAELANDPQTSPILRTVLFDDPDFQASMAKRIKEERPEMANVDLLNGDKFWQVYCQMYADQLPRLTAAAEQTSASLKLPADILAYAKLKGTLDTDIDVLYEPYVEILTPDDLADARDDVDYLQAAVDVAMGKLLAAAAATRPATGPATEPTAAPATRPDSQ